MEKRKELVRQTEVDAIIEDMMGVVLTALSSMPAQCAPIGDLATRRRFEKWVFDTRTKLADIAQRKADEAGEPALDQQG
jgi:phage terminase Nu1 subunit (DNA packaging protein)